MNRLTFIRAFGAIFGFLFFAFFSFAQSRPPHPIQVLVSPDKPNWTYSPGEEAVFTIRVLKHQVPMEDVEVSYTVGPEKMKPIDQGTVKLKEGSAKVKGELSEAGFLRCEARVVV